MFFLFPNSFSYVPTLIHPPPALPELLNKEDETGAVKPVSASTQKKSAYDDQADNRRARLPRTHAQFYHTLTLEQSTPRRVRSAEPSLPPSSRRIACAADDSQSHRAASARLHAERLHQGERTASAAWEFAFLALPTSPFASLLYFPHSFPVGAHRESHRRGRIAPRL